MPIDNRAIEIMTDAGFSEKQINALIEFISAVCDADKKVTLLNINKLIFGENLQTVEEENEEPIKFEKLEEFVPDENVPASEGDEIKLPDVDGVEFSDFLRSDE